MKIGKKVHLYKKGIRILAIAESFRKENSFSVISGIVMRKDLIIDGIKFGTVTIGGDDATSNIIKMIKDLKRNDINLILLDGLIISMYNIIDGEKILKETGIPVIALSFNDSIGISDSIKNFFPDNYKRKIDMYKRLGERKKIILKSGKHLFIRNWGISFSDAIFSINSFLIQGAIPEPIRIAKMVSRAYMRFVK
ncbi:MAG: DUF99 family protein [Nitrososphaeraceae archaeon]|nr:DUF99 family protein [Nitrososphaeraceae archaeon]